MGGIPAKLIKKRFPDAQISFLENLEWWNKPEKWIIEHASYFTNIDSLYEKLNND